MIAGAIKHWLQALCVLVWKISIIYVWEWECEHLCMNYERMVWSMCMHVCFLEIECGMCSCMLVFKVANGCVYVIFSMSNLLSCFICSLQSYYENVDLRLWWLILDFIFYIYFHLYWGNYYIFQRKTSYMEVCKHVFVNTGKAWFIIKRLF